MASVDNQRIECRPSPKHLENYFNIMHESILLIHFGCTYLRS